MIDTAKNNTAFEAKMFLYDLSNRAKEHWFKPDEGWQVSLATAEDKVGFEKKYYPTVSIQVESEMLAELFDLVAAQLKQAPQVIDAPADSRYTKVSNFQYLIAFNPKRMRS